MVAYLSDSRYMYDCEYMYKSTWRTTALLNDCLGYAVLWRRHQALVNSACDCIFTDRRSSSRHIRSLLSIWRLIATKTFRPHEDLPFTSTWLCDITPGFASTDELKMAMVVSKMRRRVIWSRSADCRIKRARLSSIRFRRDLTLTTEDEEGFILTPCSARHASQNSTTRKDRIVADLTVCQH